MKLLIFFCLFAVIFAVYADDSDKPCTTPPPGRVLFRPQSPDWIDCKNDSDCPDGKKCIWICNGRGYCS